MSRLLGFGCGRIVLVQLCFRGSSIILGDFGLLYSWCGTGDSRGDGLSSLLVNSNRDPTDSQGDLCVCCCLFICSLLALDWSNGSLLSSLGLLCGSSEFPLHVLLKLGNVGRYGERVGVDGLKKSYLCGILVFAGWQSIVQELSLVPVADLILGWWELVSGRRREVNSATEARGCCLFSST